METFCCLRPQYCCHENNMKIQCTIFCTMNHHSWRSLPKTFTPYYIRPYIHIYTHCAIRYAYLGAVQFSAYVTWPCFADRHGSGLAAVFLNLEAIFPCTSVIPQCGVLTHEEDGFFGGRSFIHWKSLPYIQLFCWHHDLQACSAGLSWIHPAVHSWSGFSFCTLSPATIRMCLGMTTAILTL